jgi:hypothetical protein
MVRQVIIEERSSGPVGPRDTLEESPSTSYHTTEVSRSYLLTHRNVAPGRVCDTRHTALQLPYDGVRTSRYGTTGADSWSASGYPQPQSYRVDIL